MNDIEIDTTAPDSENPWEEFTNQPPPSNFNKIQQFGSFRQTQPSQDAISNETKQAMCRLIGAIKKIQHRIEGERYSHYRFNQGRIAALEYVLQLLDCEAHEGPIPEHE